MWVCRVPKLDDGARRGWLEAEGRDEHAVRHCHLGVRHRFGLLDRRERRAVRLGLGLDRCVEARLDGLEVAGRGGE